MVQHLDNETKGVSWGGIVIILILFLWLSWFCLLIKSCHLETKQFWLEYEDKLMERKKLERENYYLDR